MCDVEEEKGITPESDLESKMTSLYGTQFDVLTLSC